MLTMTRNHKRTMAWCIVAAWTLLLGVRLADAFEDASEGPEPADVLVAQALTTPSVPPASLTQPLLHAPTPNAHEPFAFDLPHSLLVMVTSSVLVATPLGPPSRARPRLFQVFSIYRL